MCPWGFTRPTQPRLPSESTLSPRAAGQSLSAELFNPNSSFGFLPKPWGELVVFRNNASGSSRILYFERGQRTSLHYHILRDETFFVLDNRLRIQLWDRFVELRRHQALRVPAGVPHSLIALDAACRVLEIAEGPYESKLDIVRLQDIYERARDEFGDDGLRSKREAPSLGCTWHIPYRLETDNSCHSSHTREHCRGNPRKGFGEDA